MRTSGIVMPEPELIDLLGAVADMADKADKEGWHVQKRRRGQ